MKNTMLWALLCRLDPDELAEAKRWVASPVHNRREDLALLLGHLVEGVLQGGPAPDRAAVWGMLFPGEEYDDQALRLRCTYLLRILEDWLAWRQWHQEGLHGAGYALAAYRGLGLERHFQKRLKVARARLAQQVVRPAEYYQAAYQLELEAYQYASATGQRQGPQNFEAQDRALTAAVLGLKLRQACMAMAHRQVAGRDYQLALMDAVVDCAAGEAYADVPAVSVYGAAYTALRAPDDEAAFAKLREAMTAHSACFPPAELRDLLLLALNACIRRINEGQKAALGDALALYRLGLEQGLLLEQGRLTAYTYNNITGIALRLGEMVWAKDFVYGYRDYLEPEQRDTHFALNLARLAYAERRYGDVLTSLQMADYRDFFHQMTARILQIKVFFDTGEFGLLEALLRNTRAFLGRRRLASYHGQNYRHILKLTEMLMRLPPGSKRSHRLRQRILHTEPLTEREWLLERCGGG